jgi:hypothetical protein
MKYLFGVYIILLFCNTKKKEERKGGIDYFILFH